MDEHDKLIAATAKMETSLERVRVLRAEVEKDREAIAKYRRTERLLWLGVFVLGVGVGWIVAAWLLDPVTVIVAGGGVTA